MNKGEVRIAGYRCEGCGKWFEEYHFSHARSEMDEDGREIPVECGPVSAIYEEADDE